MSHSKRFVCLGIFSLLFSLFAHDLWAGIKEYLRSQNHDYETTTLGYIRRHPHSFRNVHVRFICRYHQRSQSYNPVWTRFTSEHFVAISVWDKAQKLWERKEQDSDFPFLFIPKAVAKTNPDLLLLSRLKMYSAIQVDGVVDTVFKDIPWIQVERILPVNEPRLTDEAIYHIRSGLQYQHMERFDLAHQSYLDALTRPLPPDAQSFLHKMNGRSLFLLDRYPQAIASYRQALGFLGKTDPQLHQWMAEALIANGAYDQAILSLQKGLVIRGADSEARAMLGLAHYYGGNYAQGFLECDKALVIDSKNARAYWYMGKIHRALGEYAQARDRILQSIELDERNPEVHRELGEVFEELGEYELAIHEYRACVSNPKGRRNPLYHWLLGGALEKAGQLSEASQSFEKSIACDEAYLPAHLSAGLVFRKLRMNEKALGYLAKAVTLDPALPDAYLTMGEIHLEMQHPDKAVAVYRAGTSALPASHVLFARLGELQYQLKQYKAARATLEQAVVLDEDDVNSRYILGDIYLMHDEPARAKKHLEKLLAAQPDWQQAWVNLGLANSRLHAFEDAEKAYLQGLRLDPDDAVAANNLAHLYLSFEKLPGRALDMAVIAMELDPDNYLIRDTYGWALSRNGRSDEAIAVFMEVQGAHPNMETAYHLALTLMDVDRLDDAKDLLQRVVRAEDAYASLARQALDTIARIQLDRAREEARKARELERRQAEERRAVKQREQQQDVEEEPEAHDMPKDAADNDATLSDTPQILSVEPK